MTGQKVGNMGMILLAKSNQLTSQTAEFIKILDFYVNFYAALTRSSLIGIERITRGCARKRELMFPSVSFNMAQFLSVSLKLAQFPRNGYH